MAIASLIVRIGADVADFDKKISGIERSLTRTGRNLENIGARLTKGLTLPLVAGIGAAIKAAVDFESSFAGVRKTVDATEAQFKDLEGQFRSLARTMPLSVNEINKVAESAGQLGVKRESLVGFTETMIKLGTATNLTADEAATSMARFANALGQPNIEIDKLGAALVALGNNGASTEKDILDMAGHIAGAGSQIKLSAGSIFGMANALSSVGIEADRGGSAISRLFNDINSAVSAGGRELSNFAAVAGKTGEAFAGLFRQDSAAAITAFVEGLHAQKNAGTDLLKVLNELGITELRYRDTVLLAANAGPQFAESIRLGNSAFAEGTALNKEYAERLKTTESQLRILRGAFNDILVTLGQAFLPILNDVVKSAKPLVEALSDMAVAFRNLPEGVRATALAFAGVLASLGPILFVAGSVTNAFGGLVKAFRLFIPEVSLVAIKAGDASKVFSGFLGTLGRFAGPTALAVAGIVAIKETMDAFSRSTVEGIRSITSILPGVNLVWAAVEKLGGAFPRLQAVMDDIVSIVRSSWILAFRELGRSFEIVRDAIGRTIDVIGQQLQPVLDAIGVSWERVSRVISTVVVPAIKTAAVAFITSLPPIQSFLLLLSQVPGFSEIEGALDRVAKRMEAMVGEAERSANAIRGMGVVFNGGVIGADAWSAALTRAGESVTFASTASTTFGPTVTSGIVKPLALGGSAADEFGKKLKDLQDNINGVDVSQSAKLWAHALEAAGAQAQVLSNQRLRQELLGVLDDVEREFGSLERAGVGSLRRIHGQARALELGLEPLANIPINFEIKGLGQPGSLLGDIIPQVPRTSLIGPLVESLNREMDNIRLDSTGLARAAIQAAKDAGAEAGEVMALSWKDRLVAGLDRIAGSLDHLGNAFDNLFGRIIHGAAGVVRGINDIARATSGLGRLLGAIDLGVDIGKQLQPLLGLNRGLLGRLLGTNNQGRNDVEAFAASFAGGFAELHQRLMDMGREDIWKRLTQLQNNWDTVEASKAIQDATQALEAFGTEAERAQRRLDALGNAVSGVNKRAELFAAPFRTLTDALKEADGSDLDALTRKLQASAQAGQGAFQRLGTFVAATFAGIVNETGNALGAIQQLAPAFAVLQQGVTDFGLTSTGTIDQLLGMFNLVNGAITGPILEAIQATGQIFTGLSDAGYMTADLFQTVAADIGASFRDLEAKGGDVAVAMALSQPILQKLWEAQQTYGAITDETTSKILKQAEEQGLVGAHMEDVNQKILDVLVAIAEVFGATLPDSIRNTSNAARDAARDIEEQFSGIRIPPIKIPIEYEDPGAFPGGHVPALASGGIVRRPTLALVGEAGPEAVVPLSQLSSVSPDSGTSTVILELDGRRLATAQAPYIPGAVRRYVAR